MKLLDHVRHAARAKLFPYRTVPCYIYWAERYIRFHGNRIRAQWARRMCGSFSRNWPSPAMFLEYNREIQTMQALFRHNHVCPTMIYTHDMEKAAGPVRSSLDEWCL